MKFDIQRFADSDTALKWKFRVIIVDGKYEYYHWYVTGYGDNYVSNSAKNKLRWGGGN